MAANENTQAIENPTSEQEDTTKRYFKSSISGLRVNTGRTDENGPGLIYERFTPILEEYQGSTRSMGYLATSNQKVIEICDADPFVESIKAKDYKQAFDDARDPEMVNSRLLPIAG